MKELKLQNLWLPDEQLAVCLSNSDPLLLTRNIQFPNWDRCRWQPKLWEVFLQQTRLWTGTWLRDLRSNYKMAMQPAVSQLTLTSSYQPQFSNTTKHTCTQIFLLTDRQAALFLQTEIFTQLFGCCCHPPTTKNQKPTTSFLLPPSSLSLSLSRLPGTILASTKNLFSQNRRNLSKPQPTQECFYPLLSYTVTQREETSAPRSPSGTWDLFFRIHRQPTVGAIYERFLPTTAALILRRSDRLFSPKIHSACGFQVLLLPDWLLCKANARYANQLQPKQILLPLLSRCFCPSSLRHKRGGHYREESTASRARADESSTVPSANCRWTSPSHPSHVAPHPKSHSSGESMASRQGATLIYARVDECGWLWTVVDVGGLVDRKKTTSLGRRQMWGHQERMFSILATGGYHL